MRNAIIISVGLSLALDCVAAVVRYGATGEASSWHVTSSRLQCTLTHPLPGYGSAVFEHRAGDGLAFRLHAHFPALKGGAARLFSIAPPWAHERESRELGRVDFAGNAEEMLVHEPMARRLLMELEQGMSPTFIFPDRVDGRDEVRVSLSPVNALEGLDYFRDCLGGMLPYGFSQVRESVIYFGTDSVALDSATRSRLDQVAAYLLADPAVEKVKVVGYADDRGTRRYNMALGKRRAEAVRAYLVAKGVENGQFVTVTSLGENRPAASNRTSKGQALNRRVTVTLLR